MQADLSPSTYRINPKDGNNIIISLLIKDDEIRVISPKNEIIINICKANHFTWNRCDKYWYKSVSILDGDIENYVATIGEEFLRKMFSVIVPTEKIQKMIATGEFQRPADKWIITSHYDDKVAIWFRYFGDPDFAMVRRISGATYKAGYIYIPLASVDEILPLLDKDFDITPKAKEKINKYVRERKENCIEVDIVEKDKKQYLDLDEILDQPNIIPEDLIDE